jgi:hypothetical protein
MSLSRIVMRLARNPGSHHSEADDHRGYTLTAPLTADGHLDVDAFRKHQKSCTVRRFVPDADAQNGVLNRHGSNWVFDYAGAASGEEPVYRLGDHRFSPGEYVSIVDEDGELLTYKVTEVTALHEA